MISIVFLGFIYEVYGRKSVMLIFTLISVLVLFWMPMTSPNQGLFSLSYVILGLSFNPVLSVPLLLDYVEVESRGKAIGLTLASGALGGLLSQIVLLECLKDLDKKLAFFILAGMFLIFAVFIIFMVKEMPIRRSYEK